MIMNYPREYECVTTAQSLCIICGLRTNLKSINGLGHICSQKCYNEKLKQIEELEKEIND